MMYGLNHYDNNSLTQVEQMNELKAMSSRHPLWSNPLLKACEAGVFKFEDFQFLFSQYYLYNKNFSRLLAALMTNCENDYYRSKLAENLWEESGEKELANRHAEIFRHFLKNTLTLTLESIKFKPFTREFVDSYMSLCKDQPELEASAVLSLGTEGIVSRLYTVLKKGLMSAGIKEQELNFFNIHIACDDAHAETLEEILLSFSHEKHWFERCKHAMIVALDLRNQFFTDIYNDILKRNFQPLLDRAASKPELNMAALKKGNLLFDISFNQNILYQNCDENAHINFQVQRVPFDADVLDPRLVMIPTGCQNEYHEHAHETVFLILEGEAEVIVGDQSILVKSGDIIFVPRWFKHQTRNVGKEVLKFFAVTDYGFTKKIPINSEKIYRLNQSVSTEAILS